MALTKHSVRLDDNQTRIVAELAAECNVNKAEVIRAAFAVAVHTLGEDGLRQAVEAGNGDAAAPTAVDASELAPAAHSVDSEGEASDQVDASEDDSTNEVQDDDDDEEGYGDHVAHRPPTVEVVETHGLSRDNVENTLATIADIRRVIPAAVTDFNSSYGFTSQAKNLLELQDQLAFIESDLIKIRREVAKNA